MTDTVSAASARAARTAAIHAAIVARSEASLRATIDRTRTTTSRRAVAVAEEESRLRRAAAFAASREGRDAAARSA